VHRRREAEEEDSTTIGGRLVGVGSEGFEFGWVDPIQTFFSHFTNGRIAPVLDFDEATGKCLSADERFNSTFDQDDARATILTDDRLENDDDRDRVVVEWIAALGTNSWILTLGEESATAA